MKAGLDGLADLVKDFQAMGGPPPDPERCPSPETILAAVRGELAPEALRDVLDHTVTCPPCAEDWRLAAAFDREADAGAPSVTARHPVRRLHSWRAYRVAAAAAVLVLAAYTIQHENHSPPPTPRTPQHQISRGQSVLRSQLGDQPLPRSACRLRWSFTEAATYDLEVFGPDGRLLYRATELPTPSHKVPEENLATVKSGARLTWQVTAHPASGDSSAPQRFHNVLNE